MIIDSFPYNGERIVLRLRFEELKDVISYFIIVESNRTQTGKWKPYYFEDQKDEFIEFLGRVVYIKLDDSNIDGIEEANWIQEHAVRRAITEKGLPKLKEMGVKLTSNDRLIVNDIDEIPKSEIIKKIIDINYDIICLNHYFISYYLNLVSYFRGWGWYGSIILKLNLLEFYDIQTLRNQKDRLPHSGGSGEGWHFSALLVNNFQTLLSKWTDNIEPHAKSCLQNKELLKQQFEKCLYEDRHFFYCDQPNRRDIPLENLDVQFLPDYVKTNLHKYQDLLYYFENNENTVANPIK